MRESIWNKYFRNNKNNNDQESSKVLSLNTDVLTQLDNALPDPSLPHIFPQVSTISLPLVLAVHYVSPVLSLFPSFSAGDRKEDWVLHRNSASSSTFCPTIHRGLFLSSGIKDHFLEAPSPPRSSATSWTTSASNLHIQFAFQDFLQRAPTIRIPKPSRGESSLGHWRRPLREGFHA